jgi:GntR family transcriptional regulator
MPGDRLPSVREVVRQVTINPNTVHRAYRELEHLGLTRAYSGRGTFILPGPTQSVEGKINSAQDDVDSLIARARSYGLTDGEIVNMVRATLDHLNLEQST